MTISEIAKLAGVSGAAVSRYFNDGYLSQEKREKIERVVKETGYHPSPQAQMLRTHRTKMVGVVLPRIASHSIARVVAGITAVMNDSDYQILLADTNNNPDTELKYMKVFDEKQVDGVILVATVMTDKHRRMIRQSAVPIVIVGQQSDVSDCVYHDDYHATYELVELMKAKSRSRIAYIAAFEEDRAVGNERTKGYRDAMATFGLDDGTERIVTADFSMESGMAAMDRIFEKYPDADAVIAATDTIAVGALRSMRKHGLAVPGDMLLAGIGNSPISEVPTPMLTTMNYEYEESGRQAASILLERMTSEGKKKKRVKLMLGHRLIERESTGK